MFSKRFNVDGTNAYTLSADEVCKNHQGLTGFSSRSHPDGWTITGVISEDWFYWVNEFGASHPDFGRVWGDFESEVNADSEAAFLDFFEKHAPESWDYYDI